MWDDDDIYESMAREEEIDELRGTIPYGDCCLCGARNGMTYHPGCFICSKCGDSVDEDTYYYWAAGYDIENLD